MTSHEFPVFRFYDRKSKRRRHELEKHVEQRVKRFKDEHLPQEFKTSITGPSTEWKTFFRQQDAFDYARQKTEDYLNVFAYESETLGKEKGLRRYLVATYPVFWHYYSQLKETDRHHYEVIPEGAVCKLYFDLEFSKVVNPNRNGPTMVETFIKYVCLWLKQWYRVDCCREDVLDLSASTSEKFSRHLIFQLKDVAFKNNIHAGQFVHYIFNELLDKEMESDSVGGDNCGRNDTSSTEDVKSSVCDPVCNVSDISGQEFSDTVNRDDSGFESPFKEMLKQETDDKVLRKTKRISAGIFEHFTDEELKSLIVLNKDEKQVLFCDMGVYTKNRNFRLLKSTKLGKKNPFIVSTENKYRPKPASNSRAGFDLFSDSLIANIKYTNKLRILTFGDDVKRSKIPKNNKLDKESSQDSTMEGYTKSPYPEIDDFILQIVSDGGKGGYIRHWTYFTQGELLIYDIARYRWCDNVQRQHRSNNIMICVDMKKGVYYQKCHDPDCKASNFKSEDTPLPPEVLPSFYFSRDAAGFDSDFDDDDIVEAADAVEKTFQTMQDDSDEDLLNATLEAEKTVD